MRQEWKKVLGPRGPRGGRSGGGCCYEVLDELGKVVLRINGYFAPHKFDVALDFVAGRHEKQASFSDFYAAASAVPANAELNHLGGTLAADMALEFADPREAGGGFWCSGSHSSRAASRRRCSR